MFKVEHKNLTEPQALSFADELETAIGEVVKGNRKASALPLEPMVALIAYARQLRNTHED